MYVSIPESDPASISDDVAYKQSAELLLEVLETMLAEKYMKYARILFCADENVPYEAGNAARILGVPTRRVEAVNEYLLNFISHPPVTASGHTRSSRRRTPSAKVSVPVRTARDSNDSGRPERDKPRPMPRFTSSRMSFGRISFDLPPLLDEPW